MHRFLFGTTSALLGFALLGFTASPAASVTNEWQTLFDGHDLAAWKPLKKPATERVAWVVEDGTIAWRKGCGDLVTREQYGDFELELEWKISAGGNSGIMFRVDEAGEKPWHSGPEVQLLDNARHKNGTNPLTTSGAIYDLIAPARAAERPVGEWNRLRLRVQGTELRCWMNGQQVIDVVIGGAAWNAQVAKSKFAPFPNFGRTPQGHILLQDHSNPVWFRAIRIRRL